MSEKISFATIASPRRRRRDVLTLKQMATASDEQMASFDIAEVDLACAANLPGSEELNPASCLTWIDRAAAWTRQNTEKTLDQFRRQPEAYGNSEGRFRVLAMHSVLYKGLKIHYNPARIDDPDGGSGDSRTDFLHGIIDGPGGTCASLPVLYVAVGRRLGYPLRLVRTFRHLFVRWEDQEGERFNIELNHTGLSTHSDDHYLNWPMPVKGTPLHRPHFLRSMSPREEVACVWLKRGYCLRARGRFRTAIKAFAIAGSLNPEESQESMIKSMLSHWKAAVLDQFTERLQHPEIDYPPRLYPGISEGLEREIIKLDVTERSLSEPKTVERSTAAEKLTVNA